MSESTTTVRVLTAPGHRVLDPGTGLPIPELTKEGTVARDKETGRVTVQHGLGVVLPLDTFVRRRLAEGGLVEVDEAPASPTPKGEAASTPAEAPPASAGAPPTGSSKNTRASGQE